MHLSSTRKMTESKYLEAIARASSGPGRARTQDIADILGVAPSSVTPMLGRLAERGLIEYESHHGANLTGEGAELLKELSKKREVLEKFFQLMGMDLEISRDQAMRLESIVSDESYRKLRMLNEELESSEEVEMLGFAEACDLLHATGD